MERYQIPVDRYIKSQDQRNRWQDEFDAFQQRQHEQRYSPRRDIHSGHASQGHDYTQSPLKSS